MNKHRRLRPTLALAALLGSLLGGCVMVPVGPPYGGPPQGGEIVMVAPPPVQAEVIAVAPGPGYFWIGGHWAWQMNRHVWVGGNWQAPRAGYAWVPHGWYRRGNGWHEGHGHWASR